MTSTLDNDSRREDPNTGNAGDRSPGAIVGAAQPPRFPLWLHVLALSMALLSSFVIAEFIIGLNNINDRVLYAVGAALIALSSVVFGYEQSKHPRSSTKTKFVGAFVALGSFALSLSAILIINLVYSSFDTPQSNDDGMLSWSGRVLICAVGFVLGSPVVIAVSLGATQLGQSLAGWFGFRGRQVRA
jgi:hypothetical protein